MEKTARAGSRSVRILKGAALARQLRDRVRAESEALAGRPAALRVILLGNDAASETYVAAKTKAAREAGIRAVILGRSGLVGRPLSAMLTASDSTVTVCHTRTRDLAAVCREADLLIAAIGRPGFVTGEHVREGATIVDVGINRLASLKNAPENLRRSVRLCDAIASRGCAIVGDVDFEEVSRIAGAITPVPGGIGPLTVAMLLSNTVGRQREAVHGPVRQVPPAK